jgi:hypothetical protein
MFCFRGLINIMLRGYYIVTVFKWYLLLNYLYVPVLRDHIYSEGMNGNLLPLFSSCVYVLKS